MRTRIGSLIFLCLAGCGAFMTTAHAQPLLGGPVRIRESKPVVVNNAQFVAIAQTDWQPGKPDPSCPVIAPIDIQLRVTNLGKSDLLFPTCGTFGIKLFSANGTEIKPRAARKGAALTGPVLVPGGASYSLYRRAELAWDKETKTPELVYCDGTGSEAAFGPLKPGRYKLAFWYSVMPDKGAKRETGDTARWVGQVVTNELLIDFLEGTTRGTVPDVVDVPGLTEDLLRVCASKPIVAKDVRFVVVAQAEWKLRKAHVPIDIQLHVTNLGKDEVILFTFDSFGLLMRNEGGKPIRGDRRRDGTCFTRPVQIPGGASYALCRKAEVLWHEKTGTHDLCWWDGTAAACTFGPLSRGRCRVGFWYAPSAKDLFFRAWQKQHPKAGEMWLGQVETDEVVIELR